MLSLIRKLFSKGRQHITNSRGGFNADFWSDELITKKWLAFEEAGPDYALPIKRYCGVSPIPNSQGTLYIGLYPKEKFENLVHFLVFQRYSSSAQQSVIQSGEVNEEWFYPEELQEGVLGLRKWLESIMHYSDLHKFDDCIAQVQLPVDMQWIHELSSDSWCFLNHADDFDVYASTNQGYLVMFVVDD